MIYDASGRGVWARVEPEPYRRTLIGFTAREIDDDYELAAVSAADDGSPGAGEPMEDAEGAWVEAVEEEAWEDRATGSSAQPEVKVDSSAYLSFVGEVSRSR